MTIYRWYICAYKSYKFHIKFIILLDYNSIRVAIKKWSPKNISCRFHLPCLFAGCWLRRYSVQSRSRVQTLEIPGARKEKCASRTPGQSESGFEGQQQTSPKSTSSQTNKQKTSLNHFSVLCFLGMFGELSWFGDVGMWWIFGCYFRILYIFGLWPCGMQIPPPKKKKPWGFPPRSWIGKSNKLVFGRSLYSSLKKKGGQTVALL